MVLALVLGPASLAAAQEGAKGGFAEPAPGSFQWNRFSARANGADGVVGLDDPVGLPDLQPRLRVSPPARKAYRLPLPAPGELTARLQGGHLDAREAPAAGPGAPAAGASPLFEGSAPVDDPNRADNFLALEWRTGPVGLTLGGGYSLSLESAGSGAAPASRGRVLASSGGSSSSASSAGLDAHRRWSAYMAMPYQFSDAVGLRPELSYHYDEALDSGLDPANEWVMGLQFSFGF
jgi:hypothetical protein